MEQKMIIEFGLDSGTLNKMSDSVDKALKGPAKAFATSIKKETADAIKASMQLATSEGRIGKQWNAMIKAPFRDLESEIQKAVRANDFARAQGLQQQLRMQTKAMQQELNARKQAYDDIFGAQKKSAVDQAKMFERGADTLRGALTGGDFVGSLRQALEGGGGRLQNLGKAIQGRGAQVAASGGPQSSAQAAQMAKLGGALAKIGTAAAGFAAVAGAVIMLIKLFMDLESRAKDMNKALLESGSAADFGFSRVEIMSGKLTDSLKQIRQETTDINDNFLKFRVGAKDQQAILAQLNQAGFTYAQMNEAIQDQANAIRNYSDVTALAITYSRTLGLSTQEAAQQMGKFTLETGMGLDDIAMQFSVITREAGAAGVQTKRFFEAVSEASSGMAFYGVRIEETARLLSTFDSLLGEAAGTEAFKQLTGQFKDQGAQENLKEFILKDQKFVTEQFSQAYEMRLNALSRDFAGKLGGQDLEELIRTATSEAELRKTLTDLGFSGAQRNQIAQLRRLEQAAGGNQAAQLSAARAAGPGFDLAMQLKTALPLADFGGNIGEALDNAVAQGNQGAVIALENLQKLTGKNQDQAIALANEASAQFRILQEVADGTRQEVPAALSKLGFFIDDQTKEIKRGVVDANGNLVKENAQVIGDEFDFLTNTATEGEKSLKDALTKDQQIATEISRNITGLSDIFEQTIAMILESIYDAVMSIYEWLVRDDKARLGEAARAREAQAQRKELEEGINQSQREASAITGQLEEARAAEDFEKVKTLEKELADKESDIRGKERARQALAKNEERLQGMTLEERLGQRGSAIQDLSLENFGPTRTRDLSSVLDQTLNRDYEGYLFAQQFEAARTASPAERAREAFLESNDPAMKRIVDAIGEEALEKAISLAAQEGRGARSEYEGTWRGWAAGESAQLGVEEAAFKKALDAKLVPLLAQADEKLGAVEDNTEEDPFNSGFGFVNNFLGMARKAQDLIIPADGSSPIITDSADTILATKPGGAIDRASGRGGRGGGGPININIYGGDERKVYNTVLKVMREAGLA